MKGEGEGGVWCGEEARILLVLLAYFFPFYPIDDTEKQPVSSSSSLIITYALCMGEHKRPTGLVSSASPSRNELSIQRSFSPPPLRDLMVVVVVCMNRGGRGMTSVDYLRERASEPASERSLLCAYTDWSLRWEKCDCEGEGERG